jgi:hypothetical protein
MSALSSTTLREMPADIKACATEVCADFESLGFFEKYGGMCVFTAHLLKNIFQHHGFDARVEICYMCISALDRELVVGYSPAKKDGYLDFHAVCIVNDSALIDFAVGSAREFFGPDFGPCFMLPYHVNPPLIARLNGEKYKVMWAIDACHHENIIRADLAGEIQKNRLHADVIFNEYLAFKQT